MNHFNLTLSEQERTELLRILKNTLGETRVEVHHTHTPGFRENVKHEEETIRGLLQKVQNLETGLSDYGQSKTSAFGLSESALKK